jgi:hypothetical protein
LYIPRPLGSLYEGIQIRRGVSNLRQRIVQVIEVVNGLLLAECLHARGDANRDGDENDRSRSRCENTDS